MPYSSVWAMGVESPSITDVRQRLKVFPTILTSMCVGEMLYYIFTHVSLPVVSPNSLFCPSGVTFVFDRRVFTLTDGLETIRKTPWDNTLERKPERVALGERQDTYFLHTSVKLFSTLLPPQFLTFDLPGTFCVSLQQSHTISAFTFCC
uniref:Uncharacterized protein n=1 Tax=Trypanosoma vivax (strain Y486) TaxID=1055687 RepID=G0TY77_TRYVY|nr:conserved hypothetical protein [Trypanosoma vivax Y486]